jgi:transcriptional regulator with XRE-family HTH domain
VALSWWIGSAIDLFRRNLMAGIRRPRERPLRLPEKLLALRKHLGLSQRQLAKRLNVDLYSRISEYERGRREPDLMLLLSYARLANIHLEDLADDDLDLPF